jgi:hypothetical protein
MDDPPAITVFHLYVTPTPTDVLETWLDRGGSLMQGSLNEFSGMSVLLVGRASKRGESGESVSLLSRTPKARASRQLSLSLNVDLRPQQALSAPLLNHTLGKTSALILLEFQR